jgi:hypothetical protein
MTESLLAGALNHLVRFQLTGCTHSAHVAAHLLDQIADRSDVDGDTRTLYGRMSAALEATRENARHV